jgi:hypothetical protein
MSDEDFENILHQVTVYARVSLSELGAPSDIGVKDP